MGAIQQPVWGMENGSQIHKKWYVLKVSLSGAAHDYWYFVSIMFCDGLYVTVVNCEHPVIDELVGVVGYDENDLPTEQGVTINLTCPPAMSITGQNSITCMENGVWEPEPTSILCKEG